MTTESPIVRRRAWVLILCASVFEIAFALGTDASDGFTRLAPSLLTVAAAAAGIVCLSRALRSLDMSVGYTVWVGIGSVGTAIAGTVLFAQPLSAAEVACLALTVAGVIGLRLADRS